MDANNPAQDSPIGRDIAIAMELAVSAIARLDARLSASYVQSGWTRRAAWTGYTTALQLQGGEVDEIDVFSWGCGLPTPARPRRVTNTDEFVAFEPWIHEIGESAGPQWRDRMPFTPTRSSTDPKSLSALGILHAYCRRDQSITPWLALPIIVRGVGLSQATLPCLVAGAKAFRWRATLPTDILRSVLRALASSADLGLQRLDIMERDRARAAIAIQGEYRSSSLTRLLALSAIQPLLSPQSVAAGLDLTLGGAGKLLSRASDLDLLVEVSGRRAWRLYLPPDLAIAFGFRSARRGRPQKIAIDPLADQQFAGALDAFDREMAEIDQRLAKVGVTPASVKER